MLKLSDLKLVESCEALKDIPEGKVLINTVNAHSFNVAQKDDAFAEALRTAHDEEQESGQEGCVKYLIPDGASIVKACRILKAKSQPRERVAGWDLFAFEMKRIERLAAHGRKRKVMFMGSSWKVLGLIKERAAVEYPHLKVVTYSPPFKEEFSREDNETIIRMINEANPDLLWIGMTAPKQEKWIFQHWKELDIHCHVGTIGAVFDFYAGTIKRAPIWWQDHMVEWLFRLLREPRRMWRRYVVGNPLFVWNVSRERKD